MLSWHSGLIQQPFLGTAGVTIFFTLSGFLITRLLLEEHRSGRPIDLPAFYLRRGLRLLPALILMLAIVTALRPSMIWSAGWAISYIGNWWWATGHDTGLFGFTWSLAIEEQFYLVWPMGLVALLAWRPRAVPLVVTAALLGFLGFTLLQQFGADFTNFSTPTNAPALLTGALMAFILRTGRRVRLMWLLVGAALVALGYLLIEVLAEVPLAREFVAAYAVLLIAGGAAGMFAWRPLVTLGRISYGVYLWHLPVLVLMGAEVGRGGALASVAAVVISIAAASVSYHVVEMPIRRLGSSRGRASDWADAPEQALLELAPSARAPAA